MLLDVHFDEDHTRAFNDNTQKNLNIIRKIALNLIADFKRETDSKKPISGVMRSCLFDEQHYNINPPKIQLLLFRQFYGLKSIPSEDPKIR